MFVNLSATNEMNKTQKTVIGLEDVIRFNNGKVNYPHGFAISDAVLNDLVRRVLDEVSEHIINDSAHF